MGIAPAILGYAVSVSPCTVVSIGNLTLVVPAIPR